MCGPRAASTSNTEPTAWWWTTAPGSAGRRPRSASGVTCSARAAGTEPAMTPLPGGPPPPAAAGGATVQVMQASDPPRRSEPAPERFRQVLGHFATGVTVITGMDGSAPVGFACQAFAALSLEP